MASVRFICGTQELHQQLEQRLSRVPRRRGHDPVRLVLRRQRRPVRDAARRARTPSSPTRSTMPRSSTASGCARRSGSATPTATWTSSRRGCRRRDGARRILIATDGVFSMDGYLARLDAICDLADRYGALVMVDDSHAVGFVGADRPRHPRALRRHRPRRHHHRHARQGARRRQRRLRLAAAREIVELLRQRSRPYLFSNCVAPPVVAASIAVLDLLERRRGLRDRLRDNTAAFPRRG